MEKPMRPMRLEYAEAEKALTECINSFSLPAFMWEPIMANLMRQIQEGSQNELQQAQTQYQSSLIEYNQHQEKAE